MFLTMIQVFNSIIPIGFAIISGVGVFFFQLLLILHFSRRIDPERERKYEMKWMDVREL